VISSQISILDDIDANVSSMKSVSGSVLIILLCKRNDLRRITTLSSRRLLTEPSHIIWSRSTVTEPVATLPVRSLMILFARQSVSPKRMSQVKCDCSQASTFNLLSKWLRAMQTASSNDALMSPTWKLWQWIISAPCRHLVNGNFVFRLKLTENTEVTGGCAVE
jgi:hypothetical protein